MAILFRWDGEPSGDESSLEIRLVLRMSTDPGRHVSLGVRIFESSVC